MLKKHYDGISFQEWKCSDDNMKPEGKQIDVSVDKQTGLIYGGNKWNCGTWMDKMGGSAICGNRGHPSTSRHGADVEINLCAFAFLQHVAPDLGQPFITEWSGKLQKGIEQFVLPNYFKDVINYQGDKTDQEELLRPNYLIGLSFCSNDFVKKHQK